MKTSRIFVIILTLTFFIKCYGQEVEFIKVDSFAINIGKADSLSIPQLTYLLTEKFNDPVLKTRAIYTWIAYNISYDCPAFHSVAKRRGNAKDVFNLRKAVCEGYANLFMEMCNYANVMCLTIDGYARNGSETAGEEFEEPNHSWNAVRINGEWKMIDVTWASGYTDKKVKIFTPQFSDTYFFPDPYKFLLNHYPKLNSWKPVKAKLSKKEFSSNPTVLEGYFHFNLSAFSLRKGLIRAKPNDVITFSISSPKISVINHITVSIGEDKRQQVFSPTFSIDNDTASFNINYAKAGSYPLTIYVNDIATLKYQIEIQ